MWILGVVFIKVQKKRAQHDDVIKRVVIGPHRSDVFHLFSDDSVKNTWMETVISDEILKIIK